MQKEKKHPEVVEHLSKGSWQVKNDKEIQILKEENANLNNEVSSLHEEVQQLKEENKQITEKSREYENFLSSQKEKPRELTFIDLKEFEEESVIAKGATLNV